MWWLDFLIHKIHNYQTASSPVEPEDISLLLTGDSDRYRPPRFNALD